MDKIDFHGTTGIIRLARDVLNNTESNSFNDLTNFLKYMSELNSKHFENPLLKAYAKMAEDEIPKYLVKLCMLENLNNMEIGSNLYGQEIPIRVRVVET